MYDYFYGAESEQFSFYRIPKVLFTEERFKAISAEAKVLYGLLLDRMSLSAKNGWQDKENRVYIIFTIEDIMEAMGCADQKAGKEISAEREPESSPENTIEVLMVEPGQYPRMERIGADLRSLQKAVDGDIQAVYPYDDAVALICGEEAKLEGKPLNRALRDEKGEIYDIVAGKFFICGLGEEDFASLPKELQKKYEDKFRQPEAFLKMGSKIMAIPTEPAKASAKGKSAPER